MTRALLEKIREYAKKDGSQYGVSVVRSLLAHIDELEVGHKKRINEMYMRYKTQSGGALATMAAMGQWPAMRCVDESIKKSIERDIQAEQNR